MVAEWNENECHRVVLELDLVQSREVTQDTINQCYMHEPP